MNFGDALMHTREHQERITRSGWNDKEMFVCYQAGYPDGIQINSNTASATGFPIGTSMKFRPYLMMFTAQRDFVPWVASQTDLLAYDWGIIS
jgi:Protein of unknown function (DUF2829)